MARKRRWYALFGKDRKGVEFWMYSASKRAALQAARAMNRVGFSRGHGKERFYVKKARGRPTRRKPFFGVGMSTMKRDYGWGWAWTEDLGELMALILERYIKTPGSYFLRSIRSGRRRYLD